MAHPRLVLELAADHSPIGVFDLFGPAVRAYGEGTLDGWARRIPASFDLCRRVDDECRKAAWDGTLSAPGPDGWPRAFQAKLTGRQTATILTDYADLEAAILIRDRAERLVAATENGVVGRRGMDSAHPLLDGLEPPSGVPFGFAVVPARWKGVNAKALVDFAVGIGAPAVGDFLSTVVANPVRWFRDIAGLETALARLADNRDEAQYVAAVADWNSRQDITLPVTDRKILVPSDGWVSLESAVEWSRGFFRSAQRLVSDIVDEKWAWYEEP